MSMNIGSMLRALMGDIAPAEGAKALELRIGQIVRGVLMEMLEDGEALVNINGNPVRAKLETELPLGKGTLLQVQANSTGSAIVLRPLADPTDSMPEEGLKNIVKSFGLPDQKWSFELLRGLKRDGYPIGKETASFYQQAAALKPVKADAQSWMAAADVAFRRGLPAAESTIAALRQTLFGPPLHEGLQTLANALRGWQSAAPESPPGVSRLLAMLAEGEGLLADGEGRMAQGPNAQTSRAASGVRPDGAAAGTTTRGADLAAHAPPPTAAGAPPAAAGTPGATAASAAPGQPAASAAVRPDAGRPPAAGPSPAQPQGAGRADAAALAAARQAAAAGGDASAVTRPTARVTEAETAPTAASSARPTETHWIGRFLQWLGVQHERDLLHRPPSQLPTGLNAGDPGAAGEEERPAAETLKQALLALAAQEEAPQAVRDAAQSLVHHITGQQLLLASDRQANAPFHYMTLFVPMKGPDGDTAAAVHVQTRRGRRGEWDAGNCRLLFDLRMRSLGETIVDVQVVDRIVSVKLMNDFPGVGALLESARDELGEGMRAAGFQLLSMTVQPLPDVRGMPAGSAEGTNKPQPAQLPSAYAAKSYRGVDYRV